jgi:hypothetical protein
MENKPHYLTVCSSYFDAPRFYIEGRYLEEWGFEIGAQITLINPRHGVLMIEQTKSREKHQTDKTRNWLKSQLSILKKELPEKQQEIRNIQRELDKLDNVA